MSRGKKEHDSQISLRLPKKTHEMMTKNIISRTVETGRLYGISAYLRELIEKDYDENEYRKK